MKNIWWTVEIFAKNKYDCFDVKAKTISEAMINAMPIFCEDYTFDAACLQEFSISVEVSEEHLEKLGMDYRTFEEKHKEIFV